MAQSTRKAAALKAKIESEQDVRNAEKLREMLKVKEELDRLNEGLRLEGGGFADDSFVKMLGLSLNMTEAAEKSLRDKTAETERLRESLITAANPDSEQAGQSIKEVIREKAELEKRRDALKDEILKTENGINELSAMESEVLKS